MTADDIMAFRHTEADTPVNVQLVYRVFHTIEDCKGVQPPNYNCRSTWYVMIRMRSSPPIGAARHIESLNLGITIPRPMRWKRLTPDVYFMLYWWVPKGKEA